MKKKQQFDSESWDWAKKSIRIMKLSLIMLIGFASMATASTYSQNTRLNLNLEDATIIEIFREIETSSEFGFFFKSNDLNTNKKHSINLQDASVEEVLKTLLKNENVEYRIEDKNVIIFKSKSNEKDSFLQQTEIEVKGKITDELGESMPGVAVMIKGTMNGTITDIDGNYLISNVPSDAILVYSFVGMTTQEIAVNGKPEINVVLKYLN